MAGAALKNPHHSAVTNEHGTPRRVIEMAREVLGEIDTDPASSAYWNHHTVRARVFYDRHANGLDPANPWRGRTFINPPGTLGMSEGGAGSGANTFARRSVPRLFWERALREYQAGTVESVFWVGFSLEQLTYLQASAMHPLQFLTLLPCERLPFLRRTPGNGPPEEGGNPTHGNYITLIPPRDRARARDVVSRFVALSQRLDYCAGAIVRPAI